MQLAAPTNQELIDFVIREARLIDSHRLDEWLDLFAEDGIYWMPLEWGQTDAKLTASLMLRRTSWAAHHPHRATSRATTHLLAEAQEPLHHHLLQMTADRQTRRRAGERNTSRGRRCTTIETRYDEQQQLYAAWATHMLAMIDGLN